MSVYHRGSERRKMLTDYRIREEDYTTDFGRHQTLSPPPPLEKEKKMRREIANSNERRRMQSINAGFQSLKTLIPHHDGEKLSKAAILQQTTDYIQALEQDKSKLIAQNTHLKRILSEFDVGERPLEVVYHDSPPPKRKKRDTESSDEGISSDYDALEDIKREMIELKCQLEQERQLRMILEEKEAQERIRQLASRVKMQVQMQKDKMIYMDPIDEERHGLIVKSDCEGPMSESMSRRNLETIVEAIRHLEGDGLQLPPDVSDRHCDERMIIPHSEDSEKDSESEDIKSECSNRASPISYVQQDRESSHMRSSSPHQIYHKNYPIARNLLHGNMASQFYCRPGVIVQKL
ncbi:transcription factor AP-4-like [Mizuhopecten yessoensis]|uniref:Transcription factor AP-4 n=1 Tax=Mizuhopecten yessoensis TaxID=6573 RepID=A0A210QE71_MIZYE|nr:transcription factor AP-4-like [Mizuhopecten yessoensis]OWF47042.1 Transcription factor AP-4 [Mizuhopecten yessoensis]